jgi:deaminated glutathione amidase
MSPQRRHGEPSNEEGSTLVRIGVVQLDSGADRAANLAQIAWHVRAGAAQGAELLLLPEACTYRGPFRPDAVEDLVGPSMTALRQLAAAQDVAILVGGIWLESADPARPYNASVLIDSGGQVAARYDKVHLFRLADPAVTEDESAVTTPGDVLAMATWRGWNLGLSVCYDLRFPELYRALARAGADVLCVPANFSAYTGQYHWQPLLQARAIENLCYVLAPAQCGTGADGFVAHGHSLVVDPWGAVQAEAGPDSGLVVADLSRELLMARRAALASPSETRPEVYAGDIVMGAASVR